MEKLIEKTYGTHIYMKIKLDEQRTAEIDVYFTNDGEQYKTSGDYDPGFREEIIKAFNELY